MLVKLEAESKSKSGDTIGLHMLWTPVLLSEALLAHDVDVCLERPSRALPLEQEPDAP